MKKLIVTSELIIITLIMNFTVVGSLFAQDTILIPEGKTIMVDGKFSEQEWSDAKTMTISEKIKLYFKQSEEYVFIGIEPPLEGYNGGWVDLYIEGTDDEILNLHASRKLGERKLSNGQWQEWQKWWTNEGSWRANYIRPDDIEENGEKKVIQLKDEGWEYQIKKSRFKNNQWKLMFDISIVLKGFKNIKYPTDSENTKSNKWLIIEL